MKYIVTVLSVFILVLLLSIYNITQKSKVLESDLNYARVNYELIKTHLENQNNEIKRANETLRSYKSKITELEKDYKLRLDVFQKQVKNIQNCEQGFKYLKNMLNDLKEIQ